jgi:flagellar biosynthetic protein FlhB
MSDASKTEKPTPQRLRRARREGKIPRSADVGAWAGVLVASWLVPRLVERTWALAARLLDQVPALVAKPDPNTALRLWGDGMPRRG